MNDREQWLHGWPRMGHSVLIGTSVHCAGCGTDFGVTTVAFPEGWQPPGLEPSWPFEVEGCPVCEAAQREFATWPPRAIELYKRLRACEARLLTV